MKNFIFILACAFSLVGYSQTCDYSYSYSNSSGWTRVDLVPTTGLPSSTARIDISSGVLNFNNAPDGNNDIRMYRSLGSSLCDNWVTEFDFKATAAGVVGNNRTIGHALLAFTANNQNPDRDFTGTQTNNDAIVVVIEDGNLVGSTDMYIKVRLKDGTLASSQCTSPFISLGVNYHVVIERIEGNNGRITLTNTDTDTEVYNCCFTIPSTITNLSFVQHSNTPVGILARTMTGIIDNTCIKDCYRSDDCCLAKEISGPSVGC